MQPIQFGEAAEEAGFESIWFAEHSHIPVSRRTPWGGREGAPPLPEQYWRTHDSVVALAAIAARTSSIRLGTGISLLAQHDPIWMAKQIASLDVISGGRAIFGIGYGWNVEEIESHGVDPSRRRAIVREKALAIREIWTNAEASFVGDHVNFEPMWSWPKPLQKPYPPIVIGGKATPVTFRHIVEYGDGWMPLYGRYPIMDHVEHLRAQADAAGRDPASLEVTVYMAPADEAVIEDLRAGGVDRVLFGVESVGSVEAAAQIEDLRLLASKLG
ncbi:MAG: LLM class F420-dependent oxidoreductase [bacterium]|nr:LLM class F420-dependent oxidoreductase [bacterium]